MRNALDLLRVSGILAAAGALAGCAGSGDTGATMTPPPPPSKAGPVVIKAQAGMPIAAGDPTKFAQQIFNTPVPVRADPFSLMASEQAFEHQQLAQNLASQTSWPLFYKPPAVVVSQPVVEPQPARRLAGIFIGDSITALIDMGDGKLIEIHPGQRIDKTEWMVVSIDSEKAVLRRVGSKKLPSEVIVRLETAPSGAG